MPDNLTMTPEEFARRMSELRGYSEADPEAAHASADDLMAELLEQLGYAEGVEHFNRMKKWYA